MKEIFEFDSDAYASDEAFVRYRDLYASGTDVERTGAPFYARSRSWKLHRMMLFSRTYGGVSHRRAERVANDGFDHFVLHHVVSGQLSSGPYGKPVVVTAGESLLLDTREPMESASAGVRLITLNLGRASMRAAAGSLEHLHGRRIGAREGALLGAMLCTLVEQVPQLPAGAHATITRTLIDLLAVAINPAGAGASAEFYRLEHVRLDTVRRLIESRLEASDFSVQDIVNVTGMSRTALYRQFENFGGVARFIQKCRLQRLREWLDDRAFDHVALAELAPRLGFSGESHASRLFKQAFGITPGAYRAASIHGAKNPTVELMVRRWAHSLTEVA
ncbi:helix-turn-helix domain-containing protein [Dyella flagellata]|uniref:HTH araC/xylS-type domain-containing protein n=1 Tax=Dyella flagellata TaxID=1867833 RepID=A0ABQ5XGK9_9GAMM|nr:helix-turn-helix domain-containing protein [Dyella flagellata]GLQ90697.1 hypothetical protein GCM10007898_42730 [Dyella flagellata]